MQKDEVSQRVPASGSVGIGDLDCRDVGFSV